MAISTTAPGGSVKIPFEVLNQPSERSSAVDAAGEAVQHGLLARLTQLEYRPKLPLDAPFVGGPVQVPLGILDYSPVRLAPVRAIAGGAEAIQHGLLACLAQLEYCSVTISTTEFGTTKEVSLGIANNPPEGEYPSL